MVVLSCVVYELNIELFFGALFCSEAVRPALRRKKVILGSKPNLPQQKEEKPKFGFDPKIYARFFNESLFLIFWS
jgi:hypothetical protein